MASRRPRGCRARRDACAARPTSPARWRPDAPGRGDRRDGHPTSPTSCPCWRRSPRPACRSSARPRTWPSSGAGDSPARRPSSTWPTTHRIPIVATGANPGFVLDLWPLTLSGLAWDVAAPARPADRGCERLRTTRPRLAGDRPRRPDAFRAGHRRRLGGRPRGLPGEPAHPGHVHGPRTRARRDRLGARSSPTRPSPLPDGAVIDAGPDGRRGPAGDRLVRRRALARHLDDPPCRPADGRPPPDRRDRARRTSWPAGPSSSPAAGRCCRRPP